MKRFLDYWIGGSDGRVNWTRVTAAVALISWLGLMGTVLFRMGNVIDKWLWPVIIGNLAMMGVNVAQFGIKSLRRHMKDTNGMNKKISG